MRLRLEQDEYGNAVVVKIPENEHDRDLIRKDEEEIEKHSPYRVDEGYWNIDRTADPEYCTVAQLKEGILAPISALDKVANSEVWEIFGNEKGQVFRCHKNGKMLYARIGIRLR